MVVYQPQPSDLILGADASRLADSLSIDRLETTGLELMELAGTGAANMILDRWGSLTPLAALILCGKGNNGGDGLVVARHLLKAGWKVGLALAYSPHEFSSDALKNFRMLDSTDRFDIIKAGELEAWIKAHRSTESLDDEPLPDPPLSIRDLSSYTKGDFGWNVVSRNGPLIVDAILGTGFRGSLRPELAYLLNEVRDLGCPVVALDLPTGLDADTGEAAMEILPAAVTISFGTLKRGMFYGKGPETCGELYLQPLGFPDDIVTKAVTDAPAKGSVDESKIDSGSSLYEYVIRSDRLTITSAIRRHKYDGPSVIVAAGSTGMMGAAVMAAKSAWSLGLGSVSLAFPSAHALSAQTLLPQLPNLPLGKGDDGFFQSGMASKLLDHLHERDHVLLIGPGLGRHPETIEFVHRILSTWEGPTVVDADALYALAQKPISVTARTLVLTPHMGELARFAEQGDDRSGTINSLAQKFGATVLSKGFPSMVQSTDGLRYLTGYDTRVFSRVGYGDVLAGLIAGYLSMGGLAADSCNAALLESKHRYDQLRTQGKVVEPWLLTDPIC